MNNGIFKEKRERAEKAAEYILNNPEASYKDVYRKFYTTESLVRKALAKLVNNKSDIEMNTSDLPDETLEPKEDSKNVLNKVEEDQLNNKKGKDKKVPTPKEVLEQENDYKGANEE